MNKLTKLGIFGIGLATGICLAAIVVFVYVIAGTVKATVDNFANDPVYNVAAVSWGSKRGTNLEIYQAVVYAEPSKQGSLYTVTARIGVGSSSYYQDVGTLGTALSVTEAVQKFGTIRWSETNVTFGSESTVVASVSRDQLEKHR